MLFFSKILISGIIMLDATVRANDNAIQLSFAQNATNFCMKTADDTFNAEKYRIKQSHFLCVK